MRLGFGKNSRKFYVFSNNYIFIQYQHNQHNGTSRSTAYSLLPKAGTCMTLHGCPSDFTVDIHVITMVRIRLWLFGIISATLGLRMLQLLCRLPIKLHSHYIRINVRFELLAIAFEHILIRHNIQ